MKVYEALMLMIAFATLVVMILIGVFTILIQTHK
ncbi:MAG: putative holin-like toxin [Tumebacillaceae bacterium]